MTDRAPYSRIDRLIHRLAFRAPVLQEILSDTETKLFAKNWAPVRAERPIFITSLPRAGTTIILEALCRLPYLASHTYRDMPFVLTPFLWSRVSTPFRRQSRSRQRAHGDGLIVSEDSPEAFEEVIWQHFYKNKYAEDHTELWSAADFDVQFDLFFSRTNEENRGATSTLSSY